MLKLAGAGAGALALAVLLLVVLPTEPQVGVRGGVAVRIAVLSAGQSRILNAGEALRPGDQFQISIDDPLGGYASVVSLDQRCSTTALYRPDELGRLPGGVSYLPESLTVDRDTGSERLYVLLLDEISLYEVTIAELSRSCKKEGYLHAWYPSRRGVRFTVVELQR